MKNKIQSGFWSEKGPLFFKTERKWTYAICILFVPTLYALLERMGMNRYRMGQPQEWKDVWDIFQQLAAFGVFAILLLETFHALRSYIDNRRNKL